MAELKQILARLMNLQVGGFTEVYKVTGAQVGVDGAAYASGDLLGDQSPILIKPLRSQTGTAILQSITIQDLSKQSLAIDVVFFDANPSTTTFTDNAALDIADADITKVIGVVSIVAGDYAAFADSSVATKSNIGLTLKSLASPTTGIYFCLVTRGAPTYVADELSIQFGILQD
jgi:hypothetical protein